MPTKVEDVEQLIVDVLKADAGLQAVVKTFDRYDGQFGKEDLKGTLSLLPGCFVTYVRDSLNVATTGRTYVQKNQFNVVVAAKDLRGDFKSKKGSDGALEICELVHSILHLNELGLANVHPGLERTGRFPVLVDKNISVFEMTFNIKWVA